MIHRTEPVWQWQNAMAEAVTDVEELFQLLALDPVLLPAAKRAAERFGLRIPRRYVGLMRSGDPADPLLRQVLPVGVELSPCEGFLDDPVGDANAVAANGLLHKYHGRVLLIVSAACAVHCRFCFRRNFAYNDNLVEPVDWHKTVAYIESHPEVNEVILSGGDPLMLSDQKLLSRVQSIASIGHVQRLRLHSRLPVVLPERITPPLLQLLAESRLKTTLVLHCNHPDEIVSDLGEATKQLRMAGVTLLNQSVLLRGVNDNRSILAELSERLFAIDVLPYYLHLLDRVQGAAHFEVSEDEARRLYQQLLGVLPGYLVPRLVRENEGAAAKEPVSL